MTLRAKLAIAQPSQMLGPPEGRTRIASAEMVAEVFGCSVAISIKRGEVYGEGHKLLEPATAAAMHLDPDERRALVAYLASIPYDD